MKLKIAVVQFEIKQLQQKRNLDKIEKFIKQASIDKANIIVFPEDFITGPIEGEEKFADSENKYKNYFKKLAIKYKIDIVTGSIIEKYKDNFYNTTYYIDAKGKVKSKYKKIHLWHPEKKYFTSGNNISVFESKYGKIGLIICWDLIFPEMFIKMMKKGVNIVICPSYWCYGDAGKGLKYDINSEIKLIDSLCVCRAFENEIIFVYCNAAGGCEDNKLKNKLIGHSQITIPFNGVVKRLDHNREEMFIQEIDTAILKDAEDVYKIKDSK